MKVMKEDWLRMPEDLQMKLIESMKTEDWIDFNLMSEIEKFNYLIQINRDRKINEIL